MMILVTLPFVANLGHQSRYTLNNISIRITSRIIHCRLRSGGLISVEEACDFYKDGSHGEKNAGREKLFEELNKQLVDPQIHRDNHTREITGKTHALTTKAAGASRKIRALSAVAACRLVKVNPADVYKVIKYRKKSQNSWQIVMESTIWTEQAAKNFGSFFWRIPPQGFQSTSSVS